MASARLVSSNGVMIMKGRNHGTIMVSWKKISWWWMLWNILSVPSYSRWTKLELQENTKNLDEGFSTTGFSSTKKGLFRLATDSRTFFFWWPDGSHGKKSPDGRKELSKVAYICWLSFEFLKTNTMGLFRESWLLVGVFFLLPRNTLTLFMIVNQTSTADAGWSNI